MGGEHGLLAAHQALDLVRPEAGPVVGDPSLRPWVLIGRVLARFLRIPDQRGGSRQNQQEHGIRPLEPELDRIWVDNLHAICVQERLEAERCHAEPFEGERPVVRPLDVVGRQVVAVVALHALAQLERMRKIIPRDGPRFGEAGEQLPVVLQLDPLGIRPDAVPDERCADVRLCLG